MHRLVQQQFAQTLAQGRTARFAGLIDIDPARAQQRHDGRDLAALACTVDAFESDETAA